MCPAWGVGDTAALTVWWTNIGFLLYKQGQMSLHPNCGGRRRAGLSVSAGFSRSKQAVPGNSSKQDLGSWVGLSGDGPALPGSGKGCSFLAAHLGAQGWRGKKSRKEPVGQHPDFRDRAQAPSPFSRPRPPPHLILKSAQLCCFQTHISPGKDPDFLQEPLEKGEKRVGKGGTSGSHQGQDKDSTAAATQCTRTPAHPHGSSSRSVA